MQSCQGCRRAKWNNFRKVPTQSPAHCRLLINKDVTMEEIRKQNKTKQQQQQQKHSNDSRELLSSWRFYIFLIFPSSSNLLASSTQAIITPNLQSALRKFGLPGKAARGSNFTQWPKKWWRTLWNLRLDPSLLRAKHSTGKKAKVTPDH